MTLTLKVFHLIVGQMYLYQMTALVRGVVLPCLYQSLIRVRRELTESV